MPKSFDDLFAQIETRQPQKAEIDVSEFFGEKPKTVLFEFHDPDIHEYYQASRQAQSFGKQNPDWDERLCLHVVTLALAHTNTFYNGEVVPLKKDGKTRGAMLAKMASEKPAAFQGLLDAFYKALPHLINSPEAAEEEKKTDSDPSWETGVPVPETSEDAPATLTA